MTQPVDPDSSARCHVRARTEGITEAVRTAQVQSGRARWLRKLLRNQDVHGCECECHRAAACEYVSREWMKGSTAEVVRAICTKRNMRLCTHKATGQLDSTYSAKNLVIALG